MILPVAGAPHQWINSRTNNYEWPSKVPESDIAYRLGQPNVQLHPVPLR